MGACHGPARSCAPDHESEAKAKIRERRAFPRKVFLTARSSRWTKVDSLDTLVLYEYRYRYQILENFARQEIYDDYAFYISLHERRVTTI